MSAYQYEGIFIGLGSNLDKPATQIRTALEHFTNEGISVVKTSSLYKTPPWGKTNQPDFVNQVVQVSLESEPSAVSLMSLLLKIEADMGRIRAEKYGPRVIDLDLLAYHQQIMHHETLTLPHPEMVNRAFVLVPWVEVAPAFWLPDTRQTVSQALKNLPIGQRENIIRMKGFF